LKYAFLFSQPLRCFVKGLSITKMLEENKF